MSFGGLRILRELSATIEDGEKVALIGPNGAGKTTLLNLIGGQLAPSDGRIYVFDRDITRLPAHRRAHIGLARSFQVSRLFHNLSVIENLTLALRGTTPSRFEMVRAATPHDEILDRAQKLLESLDLWDKRDGPIEALPYGEQRKLEIGLSLALKPRILLLDEPTAGLAIADIPSFTDLIKNVAGDTTLLFVAHDMDVVHNLASRILVLYYGEFIAQGTMQEIESDPRVREIYLGTEDWD